MPQTKNTAKTALEQGQTRDTNCHIENWFGILKQQSPQKKRCLRPPEFIRKMHGSLKGRYSEHILRHQLPEDLLIRPLSPKNNVDLAEERWAKLGSPRQIDKSKYYGAPKVERKTKRKERAGQKQKKAK